MKFTEWMRNVKVEHVMSIFILLIAFSFLYFFSSSKLPADKISLVGDIKMTMLTIVTLIVNYYFGPSRTKGKENETTKENTTSDSGTI